MQVRYAVLPPWCRCRGMSTRRWLQHANLFASGFQVRCTIFVRCAASAAGHPEGAPDQGPTKRCLRCGDERTLFYFPVRTAQPNGWVHCYACQRDLKLEAKPPRRRVHALVCRLTINLQLTALSKSSDCEFQIYELLE
jgi:hypothetical protein